MGLPLRKRDEEEKEVSATDSLMLGACESCPSNFDHARCHPPVTIVSGVRKVLCSSQAPTRAEAKDRLIPAQVEIADYELCPHYKPAAQLSHLSRKKI